MALIIIISKEIFFHIQIYCLLILYNMYCIIGTVVTFMLELLSSLSSNYYSRVAAKYLELKENVWPVIVSGRMNINFSDGRIVSN
jgi:hypothetical protein